LPRLRVGGVVEEEEVVEEKEEDKRVKEKRRWCNMKYCVIFNVRSGVWNEEEREILFFSRVHFGVEIFGPQMASRCWTRSDVKFDLFKVYFFGS
jgi:hypothetical protein